MNHPSLLSTTGPLLLEGYLLLILMGISGTLFCIFGRLSLDGLQVVMLSRGEKGPEINEPVRPHRFLRIATYWTALTFIVQSLRLLQLTTSDPELSLWAARSVMVVIIVSHGLLWEISNFLIPLQLARWVGRFIWSCVLGWSLVALLTPWVVGGTVPDGEVWTTYPGVLQWWRLGFSMSLSLFLTWRMAHQIISFKQRGTHELLRQEAVLFLSALIIYMSFMTLGALASAGLIRFPRSSSFTFTIFSVVLAVILGRRVRYLSLDMYQSAKALKEKNLALEEVTRKAQAASDARAQFVASMSHELRTPLTGMLGMVEMLATSKLSPPQRAYVDQLMGCGSTLRALIDDVLDLSRIDHHSLVVSNHVFDPLKVLEDVASAVAVNAYGKGLDIVVCAEATLPSAFSGDVDRIRQIVLNLAGNAVKYTAQGKVMLSATSRRLDHQHHELRFSITDTGPGISPSQRDTIFLPYVQGSAGEALQPVGGHGGVGLGLTIAGEIAHAIGATIQLESKVGVGSTFHLVMQLKCTDEVMLASRLQAQWPSGRKVAWVDPDGSVAKGWAPFLEAAQWPVRFIANLEEAEHDEHLVIPAALRRQARMAGLTFTCVMALTSAAFDETGRVLLAPITRKQLLSLTELEPEQALPVRVPAPQARKALVVEDHSVNRLVIVYLLRAWGFEVFEAQTAAEALAYPYLDTELTILDGELPDGTGFEVGQTMRANGYRGAIVGLTASGLESDRTRALESGFDDLVFKPFEAKHLRTRIDSALSTRHP